MAQTISRAVVSCLLLLFAAACDSDSGPPTGVIEILPTRFILPSETPTPRPTRTPRPTAIPPPTYAPVTPPTAIPTDLPSPTPLAMIELVVAIKPILAGMPIPPDAVTLYHWPAISAPQAAVTSLEDAINQVTLVDVGCFEPLLAEALARRTVGSEFLPLEGACPPLRPLQPPIRLVDQVIAVHYIPAGAMIPPSAVAIRPWPEQLLPRSALTTFFQVVGKRARVGILREQPLRSTHISP